MAGRTVKKALLVVIPLLLIGGVAGLGLMGIINIPGLTPKKKLGKNLYAAESLYGEKKDEVAEKPKKKKPKKPLVIAKVEAPKPDLIKGSKKIAKLWNEMEPKQVIAIAKDWKELDFARVLSNMEGTKASAILAELEPARASRLSREIQKLAAQPPATASL